MESAVSDRLAETTPLRQLWDKPSEKGMIFYALYAVKCIIGDQREDRQGDSKGDP